MTTRRPPLSTDARLLIAGQTVRAAGYGFTAVLLAAHGYSHRQAGAVLTALIAGTALASLAAGAFADRQRRRRSYGIFSCGIGAAGVAVAAGAPLWALLIIALTGTLSTDIIDNGPATTLEQAMLAAEDAGTSAVYGRYNMAGAAAGALGSLAVTLPGLRQHGTAVPHSWLFLMLVPVALAGMAISLRLSPGGRGAPDQNGGEAAPSACAAGRLRAGCAQAGRLFAVDAGGWPAPACRRSTCPPARRWSWPRSPPQNGLPPRR